MLYYYIIAMFCLVSISPVVVVDAEGRFDQVNRMKDCDLFKGSWVHDDSVTIYNSTVCPFIGQGFDCLRNGRPDHEYLKYRWKPDQCDIPSFNGRDFLERHRGKKIMFVGDSLSNNMWQSLTCMLHSAAPEAKYVSQSNSNNGGFSTFSFPEYGLSIMLVKNGFLVDLVHQKEGKVLKLDSIAASDLWKGMDYLIFNTYHWWFHTGRLRTWDFFQVGDKLYKDMDPLEALRIGLTTWSKWIDSNIDPRNTTVFFQGISPVHVNAQEWNGTGTLGCEGQTQPVLGPKYPSPEVPGKALIKGVLSLMMNPPHYLDVTQLSQLRKDGHPSIYTGAGRGLRDCSHWCLSGVPDTWNQLLYASLQRMEGVNPPDVAPPPSAPQPPARTPSPSVVPGPSTAPSPQPRPSGGPSLSPGPEHPGVPSPAEGHGGQPAGPSPARPGPPEAPAPSRKSEGRMLRPVVFGFDSRMMMLLLASILLIIQQ